MLVTDVVSALASEMEEWIVAFLILFSSSSFGSDWILFAIKSFVIAQGKFVFEVTQNGKRRCYCYQK